METPDSHPHDEDLERQGDFLRQLGGALLGDEHLGEDVAQSTLLALIQAPPRAVRDAGAWTAGVARNVARKLRRSDTRRGLREQAAAREEVEEDPRANSLRGVTDAVLTLAEPYRSVVLARYFEGLSPTEIARRDGVPIATVKSRLARALTQLREHLDREHGNRANWCIGLASLLGRDLAPVIGGAAATASGVGAGSLAGGILVTTQTKWMLLAGGALLVLLGLYGLNGLAAPTSPAGASSSAPDVRTVLAPVTAPVDADPAPAAEASEPVRREVPATAASTAALASLDVLVVWSDETPAPGAFVRAMPWGSRNPWIDARYERADEAGRVHLAGLPAGTTAIYGQRGGFASATLAGGEHEELRVKLPDGVDVEGTVVDEIGVGVPGAEIWLSDSGNGSQGAQVATADRAGRFFLRDITDQHMVGARLAGYGPSAFYWIAGGTGEALELELTLPRQRAQIRVRTVDPLGAPIAGAVMRFEGERAPMTRSETHLRARGPIPRELRSDEEGWATFEGLSPEKVELVVSSHAFAPRRIEVQLGFGANHRIIVELNEGLVLRGTAIDGEGNPLSGVTVRVGGYGDIDARSAQTGLDGSYRLAALAAGEFGAYASAREMGKDEIQLTGAVGEILTWDPRIEAGRTFIGQLVDERGNPCADWWVTMLDGEIENGTFRAAVGTDDEGRFKVIGCPRRCHEPQGLRAPLQRRLPGRRARGALRLERGSASHSFRRGAWHGHRARPGARRGGACSHGGRRDPPGRAPRGARLPDRAPFGHLRSWPPAGG